MSRDGWLVSRLKTKAAGLDSRAVELSSRAVELETRAAELVEARATELDVRVVEQIQDSIAFKYSAKALDERERFLRHLGSGLEFPPNLHNVL